MIKFDSVSKKYEVDIYKSRSIREFLSFKPNRESNADIFYAVQNVSFSIEKGQSVGVLGKNGAGKSTLLKLLTRIISPTQGSIIVDGSISSLLEVGAGFHHDLSGYENIYLCGAILGLKRQQIMATLDKIVAFSEVGEFIHEPVKYYSSGMYTRLAFSIGVHLDSDILVVDEALAVGDAQFQKKCLEKISEIKKNGKTIFLVSHNIEQVKEVCDVCLVMDKGKLIFFGETKIAEKKYLEIF